MRTRRSVCNQDMLFKALFKPPEPTPLAPVLSSKTGKGVMKLPRCPECGAAMRRTGPSKRYPHEREFYRCSFGYATWTRQPVHVRFGDTKRWTLEELAQLEQDGEQADDWNDILSTVTSVFQQAQSTIEGIGGDIRNCIESSPIAAVINQAVNTFSSSGALPPGAGGLPPPSGANPSEGSE